MKKGLTLCLTSLIISLNTPIQAASSSDDWQLGFSSGELQVDSELLEQSQEEKQKEQQAFDHDQEQLNALTSADKKWLKVPFPQHHDKLKTTTPSKNQLPLPFPSHETNRQQRLSESIKRVEKKHQQEKMSLDQYLKFMGIKYAKPSRTISPLGVKLQELEKRQVDKVAIKEEKPLLDSLYIPQAEENQSLSQSITQEFYEDEDDKLFTLTPQESSLLSHNTSQLSEKDIEEQHQLSKEFDEKQVDLMDSYMPSNLEMAFNLSEGKHWQVVQQSNTEALETISSFDPFELGDQRSLDFALDLIENRIIKVVEEKEALSRKEDNSLSLEDIEKSLLPSQSYRPLDFPLDLVEGAIIEEIAMATPQEVQVISKRVKNPSNKAYLPLSKALSLLQQKSLFNRELSKVSKEKKTPAPIVSVPKLTQAQVKPSLAFIDFKKLLQPTEEKFLPKSSLPQNPHIDTQSRQRLQDFVKPKEKHSPPSKTPEMAGISLSPQYAEQLTLEKNNDIQVLRKELEAEEYAYFQIVSKFYPNVKLSSEFRRLNNVEGSSSKRELSGRVRLEQRIVSTDTYYDIKKGYLAFERKKLDLIKLENEKLLEVRDAYFKTVLSSMQIKVNQENIARLTQAVEREKKRLGVGDAIQFDLEQSKVDLTNAFITYYHSIKDFKINLNHLANIIGLEGQEHRRLSITQNYMPLDQLKEVQEKIQMLSEKKEEKKSRLNQPLFSEQETLRWEEAALTLRPDVIQYQLDERQSQNDLQQKMGNYYPQLKAFADYRRGQSSSDWSAGLSLDWDLFDGLGREYRIKQAGESTVASKLKQYKLEEGIRTRVRDKIYEMEAVLLAYFSAKKSYELAQSAHTLAQKRREAGDISSLEYRDAAKALMDAQYYFNTQEYSLLIAYFHLRKEAGLDVGNIQINEIEPSIFQEVFEKFGEKLGTFGS